ncbi:hypothetical protein GCM10022237_43790 [Nocardioides ginsengisoli]|uniref:Phosphatase PAP2 family protein n=1 Tax=Nocardioides ginsengisoli TaxID=363868 RepID=A0ABW3VXS6_9ACTN
MTAAAALIVVALTGVRPDHHPAWERVLFDRVNHAELDYRPLRLAQQPGTPWVLPLTAVDAFAAHRRRLAVQAALALPVEKALEVGLKRIQPARRPVQVRPTTLRDDAPVEGGSFPSGHAALAAAFAALTSPFLPAELRVLTGATAAVCAVTRVHQGAHHPVDALGGAFLGIGVGKALAFAVGHDRTRRRGSASAHRSRK